MWIFAFFRQFIIWIPLKHLGIFLLVKQSPLSKFKMLDTYSPDISSNKAKWHNVESLNHMHSPKIWVIGYWCPLRIEDCLEPLLLSMALATSDKLGCRSIKGDYSKGCASAQCQCSKLWCPLPGATILVSVPGQHCTTVYSIVPLLCMCVCVHIYPLLDYKSFLEILSLVWQPLNKFSTCIS